MVPIERTNQESVNSWTGFGGLLHTVQRGREGGEGRGEMEREGGMEGGTREMEREGGRKEKERDGEGGREEVEREGGREEQERWRGRKWRGREGGREGGRNKRDGKEGGGGRKRRNREGGRKRREMESEGGLMDRGLLELSHSLLLYTGSNLRPFHTGTQCALGYFTSNVHWSQCTFKVN